MKLGPGVNVWHSTSEIRELYVSRCCFSLTGTVHTDDYTTDVQQAAEIVRISSV